VIFDNITAPTRVMLGKASLDERLRPEGSTFLVRKSGGYPLNFDPVRPMGMVPLFFLYKREGPLILIYDPLYA
jgi:hypothetical protein